MRSILYSALRSIRYFPERVLHPIRRRKARTALRSGPPIDRFLFLCDGNICRSPFAAGLHSLRLTEASDGKARIVESAGLLGPGRPSPAEAIQAARERGVDLTGHRSASITPASLGPGTLTVVMDPRQARELSRRFPDSDLWVLVLGDLDPGLIDTRRIFDPILHSVDVFREVYDRIGRCVDELIRCSLDETPSSR